MDFKKLIIIFALLSASGCSDHNQEYYEANIDEAESKVNECEASFKAAFVAWDEEELKALSEDSECNFAAEVFTEYKMNLARIERELKKEEEELKKEEKELKEKEEERIYKKEYSEKMISLKDLAYFEFVKLKKDCKPMFGSKNTAKCKAYNELKKDRDIAEIEVLKDKYPDGKLEEFRDKSCKGMDYDEVYCELSRKAEAQQKEEKVEYYISNRDKLKNDFNQCHEKYMALQQSKKWEEARKLIRAYKCSVVGEAASRLKVRNWNKPIG